MISLVSFILVALLSTFVVTARPQLHRRGLPGAVYTCTAPDFRGECQWTAPTNRCIIQGPRPNGVMSIGPDPEGTCTLFENFDCTGREIRKLNFPGLAGGLPEFAAFRCTPSVSAKTEEVDEISVASKALDPFADPRLAGGIGSMERNNHLAAIKAMEKDGFREGLIGLNKGVYY